MIATLLRTYSPNPSALNSSFLSRRKANLEQVCPPGPSEEKAGRETFPGLCSGYPHKKTLYLRFPTSAFQKWHCLQLPRWTFQGTTWKQLSLNSFFILGMSLDFSGFQLLSCIKWEEDITLITCPTKLIKLLGSSNAVLCMKVCWQVRPADQTQLTWRTTWAGDSVCALIPGSACWSGK